MLEYNYVDLLMTSYFFKVDLITVNYLNSREVAMDLYLDLKTADYLNLYIVESTGPTKHIPGPKVRGWHFYLKPEVRVGLELAAKDKAEFVKYWKYTNSLHYVLGVGAVSSAVTSVFICSCYLAAKTFLY